MNSKARKFNIRPCIVCGYRFSDRHHIYPRALLAAPKNKTVAYLCPNHHRYANIIQVMLQSQQTIDFIQSFADRYFDTAFNVKVLRPLIDQYQLTDGMLNNPVLTIFEQFFGGNNEHTD